MENAENKVSMVASGEPKGQPLHITLPELAGVQFGWAMCTSPVCVNFGILRIASPEMLPWRGALPHVKCSPGRSHREHWNGESEHDGTGRTG